MGMRAHRRWIRALATCALACAMLAAAGAFGATDSVVVSADIPSASTLVNGCTSTTATQFGAVTPGSNARTATGAGVCRITFGSSNATSQLRIGQRDGLGTAMALGIEPPTLQSRANAAGRILGVFGYNGSLAFAAGRQNTVFRTTNGGGTWAEWGTPSGQNLDVEAVPGDPNTWWVVGDDRRLWRTSDGQVASPATPSWTNMSGGLTTAGWPASTDLNELAIPDNDTIVTVGESRWIGVYDISANTWTAFQHANLSVGNLVSVDALDSDSFIAVGDTSNGRILMTDTKGLNSAAWSVTAAPGNPELLDVAYGSATRAYAVGQDGYVAVWDGTTWTDRSAELGGALDLTGVDAQPGSPDVAIVSDEQGGIYRTTDAGLTWSHRGVGHASRINDVHAASATIAWSAAAERRLARSSTGGDTWGTLWTSPLSESLSDVTASPADGERLLAIGANAWRSTNGGSTWTSSSLGVTRGMHGVSLADDTRGWAVGEGATILRTTDLGASWAQQSPPAGVTEDLVDVVALDQYRAVAVGHEGTILRTTNGGSTWLAASSGTAHVLTGVDAVDDVVIATGARGTLLRSTDAGATWTAITGGAIPDPVLNLIDVDLVSATIGYVAVTWDDVWRTADGGLTWTQVAGGTATKNRAIAAEGSTVVTVGVNDQIARSTDSGATFQQTWGPTGLNLVDVVGIDPHRAVIVGTDALRYEMDATPGANQQVADWAPTTNDWDSGGFFGVCLQATGGGAIADWTPDTFNVAGTCEALDSDPWRALPAARSLAAHTNTAGMGSVDLVWGFRPSALQWPGTYEAGVAFEAISP